MKNPFFVRGLVAVAATVGLFTGLPVGSAAPAGGGGLSVSSAGNPAAIGAGGGNANAGFAGGRGGAATAGRAGGATLSPGQHLNAPGSAPTHVISPGFAGGTRFNGTSPGPSSVNTGLVRPNFNNLSRPNFGNGSVVNDTGVVTRRNGVPTISRRFDGDAAATANVNQQRRSAAVANIRAQNARMASGQVAPFTRPANAWTDTRANGITPPAARPSRYGHNHAYDPGQSYLQNGLTPGQHLSPGSYGYTPRDDANRHAWQGRRATRGTYRHQPYYNQQYYSGLYYPYFVSGFFPGYSAYSYGGDFGYYPGLDTGYSASITSGSIGTNYANSTASDSYYDQQGVARNNASIDQSLPSNPPAQVGPISPEAADSAFNTESGPDSLVEAVQEELVKRGYYAEKADGMYGGGTREAIRRFQADRKLAVTGRINEATLHALQLD